MDSKEFIAIRNELGKTQSELSKILCVSTKAIQSFEQGWRKIPNYIERELLLLHASVKISGNDTEGKACWEITGCPDEWRSKCIVAEQNIKNFCWYMNGTFCHGEYQKDWNKKISICKECEVFKSVSSPTESGS